MKGKNLKLLLFIALLSILILPQNALSSQIEPSVDDYSRENDSSIDTSLPELINPNTYNPNTYNPLSSPNVMVLPSMSAVDAPDDLLRGTDLAVTGTLEDKSSYPWDGETVYIYLTDFHVQDGVGYVDNGPSHLPPNERFQLNNPLMSPYLAGTAVTGVDGTFSYNIAVPDSLEPGTYETFVWFNGSITDQSRLPSPLEPESETVNIYGMIEMVFDANPLSIFVGETTTLTVTLSFENGTGIAPTDNNDVLIKQRHFTPATTFFDGSSNINLGGTDTASLIITEQLGEPGDILVNATYDWSASLQYANFFSDIDGTQQSILSADETITVTSDTTFTLSWDDGTKIQKDSYRDATWNINGTVINGNEGARPGVTIILSVEYGSTNITSLITKSASSTATDALGAYSFWFTLDSSVLTNITQGLITVTVTLYPGALLDTFIPGTVLSMNIRLMANITSLNIGSITDTSVFYTPGDTFDIDCLVNDTFGFADSVPVELYYESIPAAFSTGTTNTTGGFLFADKTVPDVAAAQTKALYIRAVGTIQPTYIYNVVAINDAIAINTCFSLTVEFVYDDGTAMNFTDPSFPTLLFNNSFLNFFGENVTIRVRDQWGRVPLGIPVSLYFQKESEAPISILNTVVTVGNNGHWADQNIRTIIELTDLDLEQESTTYSTTLTIGNTPDSTYLYTTEITNTYQSYGPDLTEPEIAGTPAYLIPLGSTTEQKWNMSISIQTNDPGSSPTGISYVTLYYQLSDDNSTWGPTEFFNITVMVGGFWTGSVKSGP